MIPFSKPYIPKKSFAYISEVFSSGRLAGDHAYTKKCTQFLKDNLKVEGLLLTTSCTHALEMTALLLEIQPGDEVICPSFTFSSTANAFALRGARLIFTDIEPTTMNITAALIEAAITPRTKAVCIVHYAGVSCDMKQIVEVTKSHGVMLIEDMAQAIGSTYEGKPLGTFGQLSCLSFHETKNITCGEGGALIINDSSYGFRSEIIREKGTNRAQFFRGEVDKYSWHDIGSSYLPSDLNAAFLYSQLEELQFIQNSRMTRWRQYLGNLIFLRDAGKIELPNPPSFGTHNAHIFFIKLRDIDQRTHFMKFMNEHEVKTAFHYVPLHSSNAGQKFGSFVGNDRFTTKESERLLRLPLFSELTENECQKVCELIEKYFGNQ